MASANVSSSETKAVLDACIQATRDPKNMKGPWVVRYTNSDGKQEVWYIVAETKRHYSCVSDMRKSVRNFMRWNTNGCLCKTCSENCQEGILFWGPNGSLMFNTGEAAPKVVRDCQEIA